MKPSIATLEDLLNALAKRRQLRVGAEAWQTLPASFLKAEISSLSIKNESLRLRLNVLSYPEVKDWLSLEEALNSWGMAPDVQLSFALHNSVSSSASPAEIARPLGLSHSCLAEGIWLFS